MNESTVETTPAGAPIPETMIIKKVKKVASKKADPKPAPKKKEKVEKTEKAPVDRSMADVPPGERKKALVKLLRKLSATTAVNARPIGELAEKLGYSRFDTYSLVSGGTGKAGSNPRCLLATKHVKTAVLEGSGICVYLTASGVKTDFTDLPFVAKVAEKPKK